MGKRSASVDKLPTLGAVRAAGLVALLAVLYLLAVAGGYLWVEHTQMRPKRAAQAALVKVARLDEASSYAARLAAETGSSTWINRFDQSSTNLNGAINEAATALQGDKDSRKLRETCSAHLSVEKRAIRLIRSGDRSEATALLSSQSAALAEDIFTRTYTKLSQRLEKDAEQLSGLVRLAVWGSAGATALILFLGGGGLVKSLKAAGDLRWKLSVQAKERQRSGQELELARAELAEQLDRMNESRRLSEQALAEKIGQARQQDAKNRLFSKAFENSNDVVMITDAPDGQPPRVLQVNDCFERMTGYKRDEVIGRSPKFLQGLETDQGAVEQLRASIQAGEATHVELLNYRRDGTPFWVELHIMPVHDERGFHTHWVSIQRDITGRRQAEEKIYYQSRHDALTELPNRTLYQEKLAVAVEQAKTKKQLVGVLFLDIDRFKHINDSLGHMVGDTFLQQVAARLLSKLRPQDTVARIGGDEFTVLLPGMADADLIHKAAERLLECMHSPFDVEGHELFATASIGVSIAPEHGEDIATLLRNADAAMYSAKDEGRDGIRLYTPKLTERGTDRLQLETHLRKALEKNEFILHYQPQIDLKRGVIFGAEALIRWENEALGRVSPGQFIPLAEEIGLISAIGEWVLIEATRQAKIWDSRGYNLKVAVNLSAKQFADPSIVKLVRGVLEQTMLPPDRLDIELTESTLLQVGKASGTLKQLKNLGVKLSVDDFGTGYSSLAYLKSLPLDVLKIDKSFVDGLGEDKRSAAVVHALIELARGIDAETVAEGVEIERQRDILANMGCDAFQGFLVSPAIAPDAFEKLLIAYNAQAKMKRAA